MLSDERLEAILARLPELTVGVVGDLFLDRYLDIDDALTEPSLETGLDAYQVVRVRAQPGAAGTVINNLIALGVRRVVAVSVIGDDGEGFELRQALRRLGKVDDSRVLADPALRTPTYTKPMLFEGRAAGRELNRLDIKNRTPLPGRVEEHILESLRALFQVTEGIIVVDQVSEADCGVITRRVREALAELAERDRTFLVLADSRERIGEMRSVCLKPNSRECLTALGGREEAPQSLEAAACALARRADGVVFCTQGAMGMLVAYPEDDYAPQHVPAYPVEGDIDAVGAGDSTSAGLTCALMAGASTEEGAAFANLVASITIQQLGTTGTASPQQVRARWREVRPQP